MIIHKIFGYTLLLVISFPLFSQSIEELPKMSIEEPRTVESESNLVIKRSDGTSWIYNSSADKQVFSAGIITKKSEATPELNFSFKHSEYQELSMHYFNWTIIDLNREGDEYECDWLKKNFANLYLTSILNPEFIEDKDSLSVPLPDLEDVCIADAESNVKYYHIYLKAFKDSVASCKNNEVIDEVSELGKIIEEIGLETIAYAKEKCLERARKK